MCHKETVWLALDQLAMLFDRDKSTISRHIKNIFDENELSRYSVVANFATTARDGKQYNVDYRRNLSPKKQVRRWVDLHVSLWI